MLVLHGTWIPAEIKPGGGCFMLWGESSAAEPPVKRRGRPSAKITVKPHPFQALDREILFGIMQLLEHVPDLSGIDAGREKFLVQLPSGKNYPLASPYLLRDDEDVWKDIIGDKPFHSVWEVQGLTLSPAYAVIMLAVMPEDMAAHDQVVISPEIVFWSGVAKLALELMVNQRFIPDLLHSEQSGTKVKYEARWHPVTNRSADLVRIKTLAAAMPPVCRAVLPAESSGASFTHIQPNKQVQDFLNRVTDDLIRACLVADNPEILQNKKTGAAYKWMESLCSPEPVFNLPASQAGKFYASVQDWSSNAQSSGSSGAFKTCFRLEPPEVDDSEKDEVSINNEDGRDWQLRFFLQAADDPSLLIPAEKVWQESGSTMNFLNRKFDQPQERLLTDLGRAAKIFPTLATSLTSACPETCFLTLQDAYLFLRESAMYFESAGFGVQIPSWWERGSVGLGVRIKLKTEGNKSTATNSPAGDGLGILGLDSLISFDWELSMGDQLVNREEFERLATLKQPLVQFRGQWVELRPEQIEEAIKQWEKRSKQQITLREALTYKMLDGKDSNQGAENSLSDSNQLGFVDYSVSTGGQRAVFAAYESADLPVDIIADGWMEDLLEQLSGSHKVELLPAPEGFCGQLRPYQVRGFSWLYFLQQWGMGACLADDMGLGKTVQLIALVLQVKQSHYRGGQVLLICPTSVVGNWQREIERFAPSLSAMIHHGPTRLSGERLAGEAKKYDIVITTYALAYRDERDLSAISWDGLVLDEAQNIKNHNTKQSRSIVRLEARYRIALTGTPVENRLSELWSILHFLNPGYLGSAADFRTNFVLPVERYHEQEKTASLQKLVQPFILRRLKTDPQIIQDLPDKIEMQEYCTLTKEQATLYEAVVQDMISQVAEAQGIQRKGLVLSALARLKQLCNHPALFLNDASSLPGRSGKLIRLTELLEEVLSAGSRALIFTQFVRMGELLKSYLQNTFGREVLFLHGGVPQKVRDKLVMRYQEETGGPPIFILSLKAGGVGLNLTRANHVFHFDRWWNPAVENQATDRAFRIGQQRNVQVHKFVCSGTLEEKIDAMIRQKSALAESIIDSGEGWLTEMSTDQLRDLLILREGAIGDE